MIWKTQYKRRVTRQMCSPDHTPIFKPEFIGVWAYDSIYTHYQEVAHQLIWRWNQQPPWEFVLITQEPYSGPLPKEGLWVWITQHDWYLEKPQ